MAMPAISAVTGSRRSRGCCGRAAPAEHDEGDRRNQRDADCEHHDPQARVHQVGLEGLQEVVHGVTLAIAGAVVELDAAGVGRGGPVGLAAPAGEAAVAPGESRRGGST